MSSEQVIIIAAVAIFAVAYALVVGPVFRLFLKAQLSKAPVSTGLILAMRLRGLKADQIVDAYIQMKARGVNIDIRNLMDLYQASPNEFVANAGKLADEAIAKEKR